MELMRGCSVWGRKLVNGIHDCWFWHQNGVQREAFEDWKPDHQLKWWVSHGGLREFSPVLFPMVRQLFGV
uniref:Uncharacterized protein n=1 Tax=Nelumbo nucifera TaxID=4432 RepID=A0A822XN52_NELNU|nr:TPA_asm: hypothetical protein HUJ06_023150 [Nelumbo nucifera]